MYPLLLMKGYPEAIRSSSRISPFPAASPCSSYKQPARCCTYRRKQRLSAADAHIPYKTYKKASRLKSPSGKRPTALLYNRIYKKCLNLCQFNDLSSVMQENRGFAPSGGTQRKIKHQIRGLCSGACRRCLFRIRSRPWGTG